MTGRLCARKFRISKRQVSGKTVLGSLENCYLFPMKRRMGRQRGFKRRTTGVFGSSCSPPRRSWKNQSELRDPDQSFNKLILIASQQRTIKETQDFLQDFIRRQPRSRNAQLANLDLIQHRITIGDQTSADLLSACQTYFDTNCSKLYCFEDLQKYLVTFDTETSTAFHKHASNNEKVREGQTSTQEVFIYDYNTKLNLRSRMNSPTAHSRVYQK